MIRINVTKFENTIVGLKVNYLSLDKTWKQQLAISQSSSHNKDFQDSLPGTATHSTKDQLRLVSTKFWNKSSQRISFLAEHEKKNLLSEGP